MLRFAPADLASQLGVPLPPWRRRTRDGRAEAGWCLELQEPAIQAEPFDQGPAQPQWSGRQSGYLLFTGQSEHATRYRGLDYSQEFPCYQEQPGYWT